MIQHRLKAGTLKITARIAIVYEFFYDDNIVFFTIVPNDRTLICNAFGLVFMFLFLIG